ncbi:Spx/MgsR family RNA polymerase-binding regulatory protein [Loigolactobacillus coryniformis]|jgi:Spx/MgsR family transcriptional regulator|uniref:Regulatory protein Spx n=5 Tax=Loigolactobacillus TaxID=2767889 RepID=J2Z428_9LACO|nr:MULTISPECIES: Spx/MgsR family RNA polymerase-binding regulatory protein [Loigolactobacillus]OEH90157.1 ArsR family transcriptional regulator [Loigolactobacillus coryniformis subsp. coryniformis]ATO55143.1 ArsR family transcriptional regulator [Loigolactobacillus coryniformis subsp. coryniformis KCTC 3167 = DSM 20001]EJN55163.1 Regulatory protein Spx [Loigolactobacillus coryniformis subsp. coryniformis CECT 5711]KRK15081.1 negative regulator of proteolysis [Loigolactobacillus coryniformis sub
MIKLFTQTSCNSSRKARQWLRDHDVQFEEQNVGKKAPTTAELKHILSLTENGLDDIISTRSRAYPEVAAQLPDMSFNETLKLLCERTQLLRKPIMVTENKVQIGFNDDEIRKFIPRHIRRLDFMKAMINAAGV